MKVLGKAIFVTTLIFLFSVSSTTAQRTSLSDHFRDYEIATFDSKALKSFAEKRNNDFIKIPFTLSDNYKWDVELTTDQIFSEKYLIKEGAKTRNRSNISLPIILRGFGASNNNIRATITVNDDFLYGRVETLNDAIFFEPLSTFDNSAEANQIVIYKESDVIDKEHGSCAASDLHKKQQDITLTQPKSDSNTSRFAGECKQVDLAIANDHTMYAQYGSNVANFNAGVMANVNTDYDDPFSDEVRFVIVETYIAQSAGQNSWGATSDINALLNNFTSWGPSGFSNTHDLGQLWSRTDLIYNGSSSTIGLAWVGAVCGSYRYHVLEDYGGNASGLRNLVSHEIGHNFNLNHVSGSGFIMSGSVGGNTTWNGSSISAANSYINSIACLGSCTPGGGGGNPPDADFDATLLQECNPTRVRLNDLSTNSPTSWSWQIQNGTPSTSSLQNPEIELPGGGTYTVTLTATNDDGSDTRVLNMNLNSIGNPPNATYTHTVAGFTATFDNNTTNGLTYSWNFGDGNTSIAANPSHTYTNAGTYTVILTSVNDCGSDTHTETVTIIDQVTSAFTANITEICEGESISFTNQSSANATTFAWEFENGTPSTSTDENPTVVFNNAGSFNVKLTVDGGGTSDEENKINYISVNGAPNATFTESTNSYTVTFDNNTIGGFTYAWDFGDGQSSSSPNPTHTYASSGTYSVTLTSSNDCGSDSHVESVTITDQVVAAFIANTTEICEGESISFTNQSSANATTFAWEFENGSPSTSSDVNPTVIFNNSGSFNVKLTVSGDGTSDEENKTNYISVNGAPNTAFTETIDGYVVTFDNNTTGGFTYAWNFDDGETSSSPNPTHTYVNSGTYSVTLTSSNDCGSNDIVRVIVIADEVVADFTVNQTEGCASDFYTFASLSSGNITTYEWEFQDGIPATSSDENPTVSFSSSGTKTIKLTVSNSLYSDVENKVNYIDVIGAPSVNFDFTVNENTVTFDNNTTGGYFYNWDFGDGNTSSDPNPTHTYDGPGDYEVNLVSNNDCDEDERSKTVSIESEVVANFSSSTTEICPNESVQFTNTSEGIITSYSWEFQGGTPSTSTDENPLVVFDGSGEYDVILTVSDGTLQDSENKTNYISVLSAPSPSFEFNINGYEVSFDNTTQNGASYNWAFGDGENSSSLNPTHIYNAPGVYEIVLASSNDCGSEETSATITIEENIEANFEYSSNEICSEESIEFGNSSVGSIASYSWEFEGGSPSISTDENPTVTYQTAGSYNVKLTITGTYGAQDSKTLTEIINVNASPIADFSYVLNENTVTFANLSENFTSVSWNFGDGESSTSANPTHTYVNEGNYPVVLTVEGSCGLDTKEINVAVFDELLANFQASATTLCPGEELVLEDLSSGNPTEWEWTIMGEEMISIEEQNPIISLEEPGMYSVELTVRNNEEEASKTIQQYIEVMPRPEVNFTYSQDELTITFDNNSDNGLSYFWDFGDGNTSILANPTHEYLEEGDYVVMLRVENSCSVEETEQEVSAYNRLLVGFSAEQTQICTANEIQFNNISSGNATSWEWIFPGGSPASSSEENPLVTYAEAGVYDVILAVTSETEKLTETKEAFVKVIEQPLAAFEFEVNKNEVQFFNLSQHGTSSVWSFNSEEQNPIITFDEEIAYEVSLITTNGCASDTVTHIVDLYEEAETYANFSISGNSYCLGDEISFIDLSSEDITEWNWKFEGATPAESSEKNPSVMYESFGSYNVELVVSNGFNTRTIMFENYISIVEKPSSAFSINQTNNKIEIENSAEHAEIRTWFINNEKMEGDLQNYTFTENGIYEIRQLVSNSCGQSESSETIEITVFPSAGFSLDVAEGCAPLTVNFESRSTENADEVIWILDGIENSEVNGFNPTATYYESGIFGIKVIAKNEFGADTIEISKVIQVYKKPEVSFEYESEGLMVNFTALANDYDYISWDFGDGATADELEVSHEYAESGTYIVEIEVFIGDCSTIISKEVTILSSGIEEIDGASSILVYPNPARNFVKIEFNDLGNVQSIDVLDQLGQKLLTKDINPGSRSVRLNNLRNIPSGQYYISINLEDTRSIFKKLIVVR